MDTDIPVKVGQLWRDSRDPERIVLITEVKPVTAEQHLATTPTSQQMELGNFPYFNVRIVSQRQTGEAKKRRGETCLSAFVWSRRAKIWRYQSPLYTLFSETNTLED